VLRIQQKFGFPPLAPMKCNQAKHSFSAARSCDLKFLDSVHHQTLILAFRRFPAGGNPLQQFEFPPAGALSEYEEFPSVATP
jgi:hypothetical protein